MTLLGDDGIFDDLPEVDKRSCRLLGPTALVVQALMGILVILSLVYKRHREEPRRPWRIWMFDVSKQIIGQMFVHGVNVLISDVVARVSDGNACVLYFLNILIDTTLGVAIIYLILHLLTWFFTEKCHIKGFETGKYGTPPSINYWMRQAAVYIVSLTTMKLLVVVLLILWPGIFKMGEWLLGFLGDSDAAQIIFVMGIFPIIMNIVQFWLIDSIVKASAQSASVALPSDTPRPSEDADREPLFRANSDDEDEGDERPHDIENPPPRSRSRSPLPNKPSSLVIPENKLSAGSSRTATSSGSVTPSPKDAELEASHAIGLHAYPPASSAGTSPVSSVSSSSRLSMMSSSSKRNRRTPPPPITVHPRDNIGVATNATPDPTAVAAIQEPEPVAVDDEKAWAAWDDNDDWANRIGEEDWTGRRLEAKKTNVQDIWANTSDSIHVGSS